MWTTTNNEAPAPRSDQATASQDAMFMDVLYQYGPDLARFAAGYERDDAKRQELLQEVHLALWQSLAAFKGQCSLRTWAYRVAHNVGATHVHRATRNTERGYLDLEALEALPGEDSGIPAAERRIDLARILALIHHLGPPDREVMLLYLEDLDATSIGEVTGLSARNVATKVHRIKKLLAVQLNTPQNDLPNAQEAS